MSAVLCMVDWKVTVTVNSEPDSFTGFVERARKPLHQALIAAYGAQVGDDVTSEALAYAWENWDRVRVMHNPVGYLYRVGQSRARRGIFRRPPPLAVERPVQTSGWYEPGLPDALAALPGRQRAAVVLVHGFEWTIAEVAEVWGVSFSTVKAHVDKGMARLRRRFGVEQ